ncbi:MAG: YgjP-like metallopeptidase domain-containing protein [Actinomycetota bacterium]
MDAAEELAPLSVEVRRSERRVKTVSARIVRGKMVLDVPAWMSPDEEDRWVEKMRTRLEAKIRSVRVNSDGRLQERAEVLNQRYFGGELVWKYIQFTAGQRSQYGSCSSDGRIHLSERLLNMPAWVLDYVIVHELAHLRVRFHNDQFWGLVNQYPLTERARGFLIAKDLEGLG